MKKYKHLFFDLDHTLWDYESNSRDTLEELFHHFELKRHHFSVAEFIEQFEKTNHKLWDLFNRGHIDKSYIRNKRFIQIFEAFGLSQEEVPITLSDQYLAQCPLKTKVIPHSFETLHYLSGNYQLHILTNGFSTIQKTKLEAAKLAPFFDLIIHAESTKFKKPQVEIFNFAVNQTNAAKHECIMIGDNLKTDILGARNAVMDQVFFNPKSYKHDVEVTYEVKCLSELRSIF